MQLLISDANICNDPVKRAVSLATSLPVIG